MTDTAAISAALGGQYTIQREIGRGGMAIVYLARDVKHDRDVALKVLRPEFAASLGSERFLAEIKLTAALQHPNILPLFDSGAASGVLFYVMPFVRGESLRDRLDRDRTLPVDEAVAIARGIASALEHAHRQGIVHRDVKPENVLLSDGVPIVADFGIARAVKAAGATRVTEMGVSLGTPAYMSPEQAMGEEDVDQRSDLYSLGCVLYEMISGGVPFDGGSAQAIIAKHLTAAVPSLRDLRDTIPVPVDTTIQRALAKERAERWSTAAEMADALVAPPAVEPMPDYAATAEAVTRNTEPLAGRKREFAELVAHLDAALDGRGSFVLIGGEPGVGKTKLTESVLLEARARGLLGLVGHSYEMEGTPPYVPFVEILEYSTRTVPPGRLRATLGDSAPEIARILPRLRQLYPDIPEPLDLPPDQQRHYLFTQFREYLERAQRNLPLVLLFDDLHWADESTLLLIEHLAAQVGRMRILLLGTYRDVDLDVGRPFAKCLERLTRQRLADRISLRRMPESDVADLLAQLGAPNPPARLVQAIYAETEGNPFFVEEVFRHLREEGRLLDADGRWLPNLELGELEVPEGVKLVIGRRLERAGEACRTVLTAAAVIGPRFDLAVLEEVVEIDAEAVLDALEEAERAGLVVAQQVKRETRYTFAHELIRQTLLGALSVPRRLRRHLRTAEAIESVYAGRVDQHAAALAYHYFQAGSADEERTTRYLLLAGQQALAAGAFDEALAQAEKAFTVMEDSDGHRRALFHWVKGAALRGLGEWKGAIECFFEAAPLLEAAGAEDELLALTAMLSEVLYFLTAEHARGLEAIDRALAATADVPSVHRVHLLAVGATLRGFGTSFDGAMRMSDRAVAMAERMGTPEALGLALSERGALLTNAGEPARAIEHLERAVPMLETTGKLWMMHWARSRMVNALRFVGRPHDVLAITEANEEEAQRIGHRGALLAYSVARDLTRYVLTGDVHYWRDASEEAARRFSDLGPWAMLAPVYSVFSMMEADDPAAAHLLDGVPERFNNSVWTDTWWVSAFASAARWDVDHARLILQKWNPRIPAPHEPFPIGFFAALPTFVDGLRRLGEQERVAGLLGVCERALAAGVMMNLNAMQCAAGTAAAAALDWQGAERHFIEALAFAERTPHVPAQAEVRHDHALALITRGLEQDRERARQMLVEARVLFERAHRVRRVRECDELLARIPR